MKICTSIKPRRTGVVNLVGITGKEYVFQPDANGDLAADIEDKDDLANVLAMTDFFPADDADIVRAQQLLRELVGNDGNPDVDDEQDVQDVDDEQDDAQQMDALPVEANTPPKPGKKKKAVDA